MIWFKIKQVFLTLELKLTPKNKLQKHQVLFNQPKSFPGDARVIFALQKDLIVDSKNIKFLKNQTKWIIFKY